MQITEFGDTVRPLLLLEQICAAIRIAMKGTRMRADMGRNRAMKQASGQVVTPSGRLLTLSRADFSATSPALAALRISWMFLSQGPLATQVIEQQ